MKVLVAFLLSAYAVGGTRLGAHLIAHPMRLAALCSIVAVSYYSLRVAL